jgi:hypothetical protein
MATTVQMKHPKTGIIKPGFFGFSWTYLFFGFWVPLIRGHFPMAGIHFLIAIASFFSFGMLQIILSFFFNKFYTTRLLEDGFEFNDDAELVRSACRVLNVSAGEAPQLKDHTV